MQEVRTEIAKSIEKYPDKYYHMRVNGVTQEFGEALQAICKWQLNPNSETLAHAKLELIQAAGQALRFIEEIQ